MYHNAIGIALGLLHIVLWRETLHGNVSYNTSNVYRPLCTFYHSEKINPRLSVTLFHHQYCCPEFTNRHDLFPSILVDRQMLSTRLHTLLVDKLVDGCFVRFHNLHPRTFQERTD